MIAKELGNMMLSSWVNAFACVYASMPLILQTINVLLWLINIQYVLVTNLWITFIWMVYIGGLYGSSFTNFIFLANAKTDLHADLRLKIH